MNLWRARVRGWSRFGIWALFFLGSFGGVQAQSLSTQAHATGEARQAYERQLAKLRSTRLTLHWKEETFEAAWTAVARALNLNARIAEVAKDHASLPITLEVKEVLATAVLDILADHAKVVFQHRHGIWVATTPDDALQSAVVTAIYDIRDLLYVPPDFPPARPIGIPVGRPGEHEAEEGEAKSRSPDEILDLVRTITGPKRWDSEHVSLVAGKSHLVARHTPEVQAEVERALNSLRRVF